MNLEQLIGKYLRLQAELRAAGRSKLADPAHIDRLGHEMTSTGRAITDAQPVDEQTSDSFPSPLLDS